jgi:hypothetical protein
MTKKSLSNSSNLNIGKPSKGTSIGQNVASSLVRVKSVPTAGGSGIIEKR